QTGALTDADSRPHPSLDRVVGTSGSLHNLAYSLAESSWIPAPPLFRGISAIRQKQGRGQKAYLLGQVRLTGWWYFFPVALAVKSTIPFLVFAMMGIFYLARSALARKDWFVAAPIAAALAILVVCLPTTINIGIRHILPIYPLLAIA